MQFPAIISIVGGLYCGWQTHHLYQMYKEDKMKYSNGRNKLVESLKRAEEFPHQVTQHELSRIRKQFEGPHLKHTDRMELLDRYHNAMKTVCRTQGLGNVNQAYQDQVSE